MAEIIKKATIGNAAFWVFASVSIGLLVAGFTIPPTGVIDGSVLTAVGELFAFASLFTVADAISKGIDAKIKHGNTSLTIGDMDFNMEENENETEDI